LRRPLRNTVDSQARPYDPEDVFLPFLIHPYSHNDMLLSYQHGSL